MTAYELDPLIFCQDCYKGNHRLSKATAKPVAFMEKRCDLCNQWIDGQYVTENKTLIDLL